MSVGQFFALVWSVLNSPAGITAVAGFILWLLNKVYAAKPAWKAYEGTIIAAVKFAEKEIPDDTPNKSLARLDAALKYVLQVYQEAQGKAAPPDVEASIKEGIQIVHNSLEQAGTL